MARRLRIPIATAGRRLSLAGALRRRGRTLRRDESGVSMLEFGLFFPILALLVLGTIDMAKGLSVKFALEQATQRTAEMAAMAGRARADYTYLATEAMAAAGVPLANVNVDQWLECNNARQPLFTGFCPAGQQAARYVNVTIFKDYTPMFRSIPFMRRVADANGKIRITADSGVRVQ
jgi:Flp pilus assembly protein TadG